MFKINDYVVFGSTGVCQITDIIDESFGGPTEKKYYVLTPLHGNSSTIYVPVDNDKVVLRKILKRSDIDELISIMPDLDNEWINEDSPRKALFNEILQSGDLERVIHMIKIIYRRRQEVEEIGKKLSNADTESLKAAEKLLHNEFALVLDIEPDEVGPFIRGEIQVKQKA
ncbi:MAG: CarD family transcriptional regulator [Saccharofermentanales bacterium]